MRIELEPFSTVRSVAMTYRRRLGSSLGVAWLSLRSRRSNRGGSSPCLRIQTAISLFCRHPKSSIWDLSLTGICHEWFVGKAKCKESQGDCGPPCSGLICGRARSARTYSCSSTHLGGQGIDFRARVCCEEG